MNVIGSQELPGGFGTQGKAPRLKHPLRKLNRQRSGVVVERKGVVTRRKTGGKAKKAWSNKESRKTGYSGPEARAWKKKQGA